MNRKSFVVPLVLASVLTLFTLFVATRWLLAERGAGPGGRHNLLIITLDTTRADRLGCYGYGRAWTPALDRLAAQGVTFEQAFATVPMTLPSHATIFTGLLPPEHGLRTNGEWRLGDDVGTLAEVLRDRGYETAAFIASFTLDSRNGLDRGFDVYDDDMSAARGTRNEPLSVHRSGDLVTDAALAWLASRKRSRPFFCWVHLFDPHTPYEGHASLAGTPLAGAVGYDAEIAFVDQQVARLRESLEKAGIAGRTLLLVVGDHGEGLEGDPEKGHGQMLYDATIRVPLILAEPGRIPEGRRVGALVSLVDLYGTIEELLDLGRVDPRSGRSLAAAVLGSGIDSRDGYLETDLPHSAFHWCPLRGLVTPEWKYVRSSKPHLFDRRTDSAERRDRATERPEVVSELERKLVALEGSLARREATRLNLDAEAIQRLASLGYVGGNGPEFDPAREDRASLKDVYEMGGSLEEYARAKAARGRGRREEQVSMLRELLGRSPETWVWRKELAVALSETGRLDEALVEIGRCIEARPDDADSHYVAGMTRGRKGDTVGAVKSFGDALRVKPDHAQTHAALAGILQGLSDPAGAARHAAGGRASPPEALAAYALGVVLANAGRVEEAIGEFERARRANPEDPLAAPRLADAYRSLGETRHRRGSLPEAADAYARAVRLDPMNLAARADLGIVLAKLGKLDEGIREIDAAMQISPDDPRLHYLKAEMSEARGDRQRALDEYRRSFALAGAAGDRVLEERAARGQRRLSAAPPRRE